MLRGEILAIGNELLLGDVQDTNSYWLCRRFAALGGRVRRVVLVRDEVEAIVAEVQGALARETDLLLIGGGLGPTDDDLTLQAVAAALGRLLEEHSEALAIVERRYRELAEQGYVADAALTPARRKMAYLPEKSTPIFNPVGTAPAVLLHEGKSTIICLPGVPAEMRGIVEGPLQPLLQEILGAGAYAEWAVITDCGDESTLAPLLRRVIAMHPGVYVKSLATHFGSDVKLRVILSTAGQDTATVQAELQAALDDLQRELYEGSIGVCGEL